MGIDSKTQKLIIYIILAVAIVAVYWQVPWFDFVNIDDGVYVTQNSRVQSGITFKGFRWAFLTTYAEFWHPLTWLSLMLDCQLYGLNAGGYHLTNLILHIMSTFLLFWLFTRMTRDVWKSAFVAAFFALHPLHVESVAWVAERKDVLSAFFWMLTLCLYVYYTEKPAAKRYLLVIFSFILALMSKPMVVTLPVILILLDYWPLSRHPEGIKAGKFNWISWQLKEKTPLLILSAIFSIMAFLAQRIPAAIDFPLYSRIINALISFVTYLRKTFWPYDLAVFYPFSGNFALWHFWGAVFLIIFITAIVIAMAKRFPYLFVGWFWYALMMIPVIGIIQVGKQAMADRYTYLPLIGIGIMLAWGVPLLFKRENIRKRITFLMGMFFVSVLALAAWQQCGYWKNNMELFNHALRVTKNNYLAHNNLGLALFNEGRTEEAINQYNLSLRITPLVMDHVLAYNNRGIAYSRLGMYQNALEDLNKAIEMKSDYADAYGNRGVIYSNLGQNQRAFEDFNKAIQLQPDFADLYNNRGVAYTKLGLYQSAVEDFSKAIDLNPYYADAYYKRGVVYLAQRNTALGCRDALKACDLGNCEILKSAQSKGDCQ
jgi:tetratricopeptide (TPR) repeat protein